jgi:hypothetical protein
MNEIEFIILCQSPYFQRIINDSKEIDNMDLKLLDGLIIRAKIALKQMDG